MPENRGRKKKAQRDTKSGKRVVVYLRVSTEEQAKAGHYGLDAQERVCREYCESKQYDIVAIKSDEGISGTVEYEKREGLLEAMTMCANEQADCIVVYALDRYARKSSVLQNVIDHAKKNRYRLEVKRENIDLADPSTELSRLTYGFVSEMERVMIAIRLRGGREERGRLDGRGTGALPYGYTKDEKGYVVIEEDQAKVVRMIIELHIVKGLSMKATCDALNEKGYKPPHAAKVVKRADRSNKNSSEWTTSHIQTIKRNLELYTTGVRRWDRHNNTEDAVVALQKWPSIYELAPQEDA